MKLSDLKPGDRFRVLVWGGVGKVVRLSPSSATVRYDEAGANTEIALSTEVERVQ